MGYLGMEMCSFGLISKVGFKGFYNVNFEFSGDNGVIQ